MRTAWLLRLDAAVAAAERALVVALLTVMVSTVFLDALHRMFAADEGRLAALLVRLLPAGAAHRARAVLAPALLGLATAAIAYAALRSAERPHPPARRRAALLALAITLVLAVAVQALIRVLPSGLVWSQQLSLALLLWVGLLGASLAARERAHIAFELADKVWPARLRPAVGIAGRVAAAAFSFFLAVLAFAFARGHYQEWASSGGAAGLLEALPVPRFVVYGFLPVPLAVMACRFLGHGLGPAPEPRP